MTGVPDLRKQEGIVDTWRWDTEINSNREHEVVTGLSRQTREEKGNARKTKDNNTTREPDTRASVVWYG